MTRYEELLARAEADGVEVIEVDHPMAPAALYVADVRRPVVAVRAGMTGAEAVCACAEAVGLHHAGYALPGG